MDDYRCQNCGSSNLSFLYDNEDEDDGIPMIYEDYFCEECGCQNTYLNGEDYDYYPIEQAEEDKWK